MFRSRFPTFQNWMNTQVYYRETLAVCSLEEALNDFFYNGISPWIQSFGYTWNKEEDYIARKFLRFSYELHCALLEGSTVDLLPPEPFHRNLPEDRESFEFYVNVPFLDFLDDWKIREEIVGTRFEFMILEFCYIWIDVTAGKPGRWTLAALEMNDTHGSDEDLDTFLPDGNAGRRKYDLY